MNACLGTHFQGFTLRNSQWEGGYDLFDMEGNLDGMLIENNVLGPMACQTDGNQHADGFQLGNGTFASGTVIVRGNWVDPDSNCGKTGFWYDAGGNIKFRWDH